MLLQVAIFHSFNGHIIIIFHFVCLCVYLKSFVDGNLDYCILTIVNSSAVNIGMHVSFQLSSVYNSHLEFLWVHPLFLFLAGQDFQNNVEQKGDCVHPDLVLKFKAK